jgi:hypothetical protein
VAKLPTDLSGREVRAALERAGFVFRRQTGSHMILRRDAPYDAVDKKLQVLCSLERAAKRYNPKRVDENAR